MTRAQLVEWVSWQVRKSRNVKNAALDLLSELDSDDGELAEAARRVPEGGPALRKFLRDVENQVEEIK